MKKIFAFLFAIVAVGGLFWPVIPSAQEIKETIYWTAPGDDGDQGRASEYMIRYSTQRPLNVESWWRNSTFLASPLPGPPYVTDSILVDLRITGADTLYILLKTADEVPNWSDPSNVLALPIPDTTPPRAIIDVRRSR